MTELPAVTCLCPTCGRFSLLREALACFLAQDYANGNLLILNDGCAAINGSALPGNVTVLNRTPRYANLGEKRRALLEASSTELVAHWDDDDLYLPWHLTRSVEALMREGAGCVKSRGAFYMVGSELRGIRHNVFEGSMLFHRDEALALGGYPPKHSGQAKALMDAFERAGRLYKIPDDEGRLSYVYRWGQGVGHISGIGNGPEASGRFEAANQDFGSGEPLTPADLTPHWHAVTRAAFEQGLSVEDRQTSPFSASSVSRR